MPKLTPVTLTLTIESVFRFRNLRLEVSKIDPTSHTNLGMPLIFAIHTPLDKTFPCIPKILTAVTLTLTSESVFRFRNLCLGFES